MGVLQRTQTANYNSSIVLSIRPKRWSSAPNKSRYRFNKSPSRLPLEILERIIYLAIADRNSAAMLSTVASFKSISGFTRASRRFRQIALRQFFRHISLRLDRFEDQKTMKMLFILLDARQYGFCPYECVRSLHATSTMLDAMLKSLMKFTNLRDLRISFDDVNLRGQQKAIQTLITRLPVPSLTLNAERSLRTLILTFLPRVDVPLLRLIASTFPFLANLVLSCTERLYSWHLEENWSCTNHSPIPDMFVDAHSLAAAFSKALRPLTVLIHLHLGVYLSHEDLTVSHLEHVHEGGVASQVGFSAEPDRCATCIKNWRHPTRRDELLVSSIMAGELPSLRVIGWSSFFAANSSADAGDSVPYRTARIAILRKGETTMLSRLDN